MEYQCTEERFFEDIKDHSMKVIRDDGVNRHISFTKNGSSVYRFDLITWPGFLCITGDCGTYVFRRLLDMFEFFRADEKPKQGKKLFINAGYWGEKLESICTTGGYKEFDKVAFKARVTKYFDNYWEGTENLDAKAECWEEIESDVLSCIENDHQAYDQAYNFSYGDFSFQDFFDGGSTKQYTFHYIWCLYAIAYGIKEYDKSKTTDTCHGGLAK